MNLDLAIVLALIGLALPTGFVCYWIGVSHAERRAKAREQVLLDDLDYMAALIVAEPSTPVLRLVGGGR